MKNTLFALIAVAILAAAAPAPRVITVKVTGGEYQPAVIKVKKGESVRLKFLRTADPSCGSVLSIPALKVKKTLPLNQPFFVDFKAPKSGELAFSCGMNMMKGQIVVQ